MKASTVIVSTALVLGLLGLAYGQELKASGEPRKLLQDDNLLQADGAVAVPGAELHGKPRELTTHSYKWYYPKTSDPKIVKIAKWFVDYINDHKDLRKAYLGSYKYKATYVAVTYVKYYIEDYYKYYTIKVKIQYLYYGYYKYKTLTFKVKVKDYDYYLYHNNHYYH